MAETRSGVAVVLSGGGARGAYEAGALSVLLPALEAAGRRPTIFLGTSAGAINAAAFASMSHLSAAAAAAAALELWRDVRAESVFRRPRRARHGDRTTRGGPARGGAILDSAPLAETLGRVIDWDQLHRNVDAGLVSVGVVATAFSTHRSAVFLEPAPGVACPPTDVGRSIDYVPTPLTPGHVVASAAIPVAFPAFEIEQPCGPADWYVDGGLRLNTPLKPALALGAGFVVVVATDPAEPWVEPSPRPRRPIPSVAGAAAQVLYAMLTDRMVEDLRTLARKNERGTPQGRAGPDAISWLFTGPPASATGALAHLAGEVLQGLAPGQGRGDRGARLLRRTLGRWVAADPHRLELLTHLFFDPDFIAGAILLGQRDARRSLDATGAPVWQLTGPVTA